MTSSFDCVVCGSCVADILVRPVSLNTAIGGGRLFPVEPIEVTTGGIACNAGIALARLGMRVATFSYVGADNWGPVIRERLHREGVDIEPLVTHESAPTSTTVALIDASGERSFAHCVGAPRLLNKQAFLDRLPLFAQSRMMLLGYYSLLPNLEQDLPDVLAAIRGVGCRTALDSAGKGGSLQPLDRILPHLDVYVPSHAEASSQAGTTEPRKIIEVFRGCGAPGLLGVKLGSDGAILSPAKRQYIEIACVTPPGPVVDTTGAGDSFYAGLLAGILKGMSIENAGRLAAATGACCVTGYGATAGLRNFAETATLAKLSIEEQASSS